MPSCTNNPPPALPRSPAMPLVRTSGDRRTLEFVAGEVQSEMRLSNPYALVLDYTRAMMGFALFVSHPRHIVMVGLGGGSLAKFCYRNFPAARITVIELRADVIALREQFCVPPDDQRFRVIHGDAADCVGPIAGTADVVVVDGFDESGLVPALGSSRFYADCRRALRHGGVLVVNVFSYDPQYVAMSGRLRLMFDNRICWFDNIAGNNRILFAVKAPFHAVPAGPWARPLRVQQALARRQGLGAGFLNRLLIRTLVRWLEWR